MGTAMLPSSTKGYLYTSGAEAVTFGASVVVLATAGALCALLM